MNTEIIKVGEKGQITIPIKFRENEQIKKGELLEAVDLGDGSILFTKVRKKQEFMTAMKILGEQLKKKGIDSEEKIIKMCKDVRKEVYNEGFS